MKIVVCVKSKAIVANLSKLLPEDEISTVSLAESQDGIADADVLIPSMAKITKETIAKAKSLKLIQQYGAGLDGVDVQAAMEKASTWRTCPANTPATANRWRSWPSC